MVQRILCGHRRQEWEKDCHLYTRTIEGGWDGRTVDAGFECGVTFAGFTSFDIGDTFETYRMERIN